MTPAPPRYTDTRVHVHTHTHTPLHSGLTSLPRHPGLRDILFPKNRSCGPCSRPFPNCILPSRAPASPAGPCLQAAAELTPEVVLAEPAWRRPSLGGTTWVPPSPGCLILTRPPAHTLTLTLTLALPSLMPQSQFQGHPSPSYLEFVCSPEFSWACREAVARASWPPQACLGSPLHLLFLLPLAFRALPSLSQPFRQP